ncbi:MAG: class II SORL domain-containing protein [Planctomycetia bacterium]|nr:class II SORL domain-containing protein [Planctomycetia bacterium]
MSSGSCSADEKEKCEQDLFCGVNVVKDPKSMTDLEKKHTPVITAPASVKANDCFEVTVEVGKLLAHPNEPGHFIEFVELYAGETYLARMDFTAGTTCPTMKVCIALAHAHGTLRAFIRCNLHGTWEGDAPIEVKG